MVLPPEVATLEILNAETLSLVRLSFEMSVLIGFRPSTMAVRAATRSTCANVRHAQNERENGVDNAACQGLSLSSRIFKH